MKVKYLGTGSGSGFPVPSCECETCSRARKEGGRNIRTRPAAVIDDELLVDISPDIFMQCEKFGVRPEKLNYVLITHHHKGHLSVEKLIELSNLRGRSRLFVYGSAETEQKYMENLAALGGANANIGFVRLSLFKKTNVGPFTVTALKARHVAGSYIYIIERNGKRMLYGNDSGYLPEDTWDYLVDMPFDFVSLDCNNLTEADIPYHMTIEDNSTIRKRLFQQGCTHSGSRFASTHFSHKGGMLHRDINEAMRLMGFITAYDGLEVNF